MQPMASIGNDPAWPGEKVSGDHGLLLGLQGSPRGRFEEENAPENWPSRDGQSINVG
jgi:hypothetical protein